MLASSPELTQGMAFLSSDYNFALDPTTPPRRWASALKALGLWDIFAVTPAYSSPDAPPDYTSPDLEHCVAALARDFPKASLSLGSDRPAPTPALVTLGRLATHLSEAWAHYQRYCLRPEAPTPTPSRFMQLLTDTAWLPGADGAVRRPTDCFLETDEVRRLLGGCAASCSVYLQPDMARAIGVRDTVSTQLLLHFIKEWMCDGDFRFVCVCSFAVAAAAAADAFSLAVALAFPVAIAAHGWYCYCHCRCAIAVSEPLAVAVCCCCCGFGWRVPLLLVLLLLFVLALLLVLLVLVPVPLLLLVLLFLFLLLW